MTDETITVAAQHAGMRLDAWLAEHTSVGSRSRAKKTLESGKVRLDGVEVGRGSGGTRLEANSVICIAWARPGTSAAKAQSRARLDRAGVRLLFADAEILVVDKPTGLLTDTATSAQFKTRDSLCKQLRNLRGHRVWPAHRLDRDTTGVVAFATSEAVQENLRAQWAARTPDRVYLAIVQGRMTEKEGHWADWMAWDARKRLQQSSKEGALHAVLAEADWKVVQRGHHATAIEVRLISGRRNQIRLHAMLAGHPILGEELYVEKPMKKRAPRQALHARRLAFNHPTTGKRMSFEAPVPPDMARILSTL